MMVGLSVSGQGPATTGPRCQFLGRSPLNIVDIDLIVWSFSGGVIVVLVVLELLSVSGESPATTGPGEPGSVVESDDLGKSPGEGHRRSCYPIPLPHVVLHAWVAHEP